MGRVATTEGAPSPQLPQWFYDLTDRERASGLSAAVQPKTVGRMPLIREMKVKAGDKGVAGQSVKKRKAHEDNLKVRRAWDAALAPVKSLPMTLITGYFTGNSLQMVTMSMVLYMFFLTPLQQMVSVNQVFEPFEGGKSIRSDILITKIVYLMCHCLTVAAGVWKVGQMGLLPNHASDWLAWEQITLYLEHAAPVSAAR